MKEEQTKLNMRGRWEKVPLNDDGDPAFASLKEMQKVFSDDEILILAHKALYFMGYQRSFHNQRRAELKEYKEMKRREEAKLRSRGLRPGEDPANTPKEEEGK